MNRKIGIIIALILAMVSPNFANDCYPTQTDRDLVYDNTSTLSSSQKQQLNNYLVNLSNQTSNQIVVLILGDLCGEDPAMFTTELGHQWGVGRKDEDNGLVILVKPTKENGGRTTQIAVGYGLEGAIPDATAKMVIENEMNPLFKKGDIFGGLKAGLEVLVPLATGEFNSAAYAKQAKKKGTGTGYLIGIVILIVLLSKLFGARSYARQNNMSIWTALFMGNIIGSSFGGSGRVGGYNNFNSGSGGFGGFGGGGFGGGGAGGDW